MIMITSAILSVARERGRQNIFNIFQMEKSSNDKEKIEVTEEEALAWIKLNNKNIIDPNEWRNRYYERLGIEKKQEEHEAHLEKEDQFENDKYYINFFSQRTSENIRNRYLSRLMIADPKEGEERPRKKNQHIFIFDWDDTILCTTFLSSFQFLDIGPDTKSVLEKLDQCSHRLLDQANSKAEQIFIITNAAKGWVEYSSKIYLPKTHSLMASNAITIISARSMFGEDYPGDFGRWKIEAFKSILKTTDRNLVTNLICIGDSNIEMEAAHSLSKEFQHSLVKTIKFRQNPKPQQLIKQQELVYERMKEIFESTKNLTIRLQRKNSKEKK